MMKVVARCLWCSGDKLEMFAHRKDGVGILCCTVCGLYMVDAIPENLDEYYYQEGYYTDGANNASAETGYSEMYDLMAPAFLFWQNSLVEELNETHQRKNFLEIGCATGSLLEMIHDSQPHLDVEGIDVSEYGAAAARAKGLRAQAGYIESYVAKPKKDIIFSSETMEHLDNLRSFLQGVAANLKNTGTFLFYVPSIAVADAKKDPDHYLRFNTNLEHLLHFTPEFFKRELPKFFDAEVYIKEFITGFGPCIIGMVSKDASNLADLQRLLEVLETKHVLPRSTDLFLKNLAVVALKFGDFKLADTVLGTLQKRESFSRNELALLNGLRGYHLGELVKSSRSFEEYLKAFPGSRLAIRSILANERELNSLYAVQISTLQARLLKAEAAERELSRLKQAWPFRGAKGLKKVLRGALPAAGVQRLQKRSSND